MNDFIRQALEYVRNTGSNATKEQFLDDFEPIGDRLWMDCAGLIALDANTHCVILTQKGKELLNDQ
jgi:hypothetical protein